MSKSANPKANTPFRWFSSGPHLIFLSVPLTSNRLMENLWLCSLTRLIPLGMCWFTVIAYCCSVLRFVCMWWGWGEEWIILYFLFPSWRKLKIKRADLKGTMSLASMGLPGANSTVSINNRNVTSSSSTSFGEADLSVLTYPGTAVSTLY